MHVLLVEDDLPLGAALQRALQLGGYQCTWVRRVVDAWAQLGAEVHAALLLDINLPDGSGFDMLQELSAAQPRLPTILISARDTLGDKLSGLQAGADDYLVKPFAPAELIARLQAVIRRTSGFGAQHWQVGLMSLALDARIAKVDGREVDLTRKEFDTLMELARCQGQVVTRQTLVDRVWGPGSQVSDGALDVHMHSLRRKIHPVEIHTVRGVGYCFKAK